MSETGVGEIAGRDVLPPMDDTDDLQGAFRYPDVKAPISIGECPEARRQCASVDACQPKLGEGPGLAGEIDDKSVGRSRIFCGDLAMDGAKIGARRPRPKKLPFFNGLAPA